MSLCVKRLTRADLTYINLQSLTDSLRKKGVGFHFIYFFNSASLPPLTVICGDFLSLSALITLPCYLTLSFTNVILLANVLLCVVVTFTVCTGT